MLKPVGNTPSLAYACQAIFWVHYSQCRLQEVLDAVGEAWKHARLAENVAIQAVISLDLGRFLFNINRDAEAWDYLKLSLMKASDIKNWLGVAGGLEYMGYGYLHRDGYQNVFGAYEATAEKYVGTVEAHVTRRCEENMAKIKEKEENTDIVIGFYTSIIYRPSLNVDKTLFYSPCSGILPHL